MNKEEIERQLKLSKKQNKDKRYDYLDSEFNAINYCIKLEKYTNKVLQENKKLKKENKQLKDNWNKLKKELKDKFKEYRYVEDECLRIMAQEDDSILFSMSCIEKGGRK